MPWQVISTDERIEVIRTDERPDYMITTDLEDILMRVNGRHSNEAMKLAIDAATVLTDSGVLAIAEY